MIKCGSLVACVGCLGYVAVGERVLQFLCF